MPDDNRKPEREEVDPATLEKLLEIELMQKRVGWQQAKARRGSWRLLSFLFLFAVLAVALVGFYLVLSPEHRKDLLIAPPSVAPGSPTPSPTPASR